MSLYVLQAGMRETCWWQRHNAALIVPAAARVEGEDGEEADASSCVVSATEAKISILRSKRNGRYKLSLGFYGIHMTSKKKMEKRFKL
ncbi:hypothetical protein AVEN_18663-1 [Araneus ventricosus]|uniref:Uncharacterized protein n=1 Tax=Araneus ventricosus TaxID=182803 RepID=A0A4Y2TJQ3_ARAVE|nr:hypothetical protein AVEN_18663-1 [Araneus ventricosus]